MAVRCWAEGETSRGEDGDTKSQALTFSLGAPEAPEAIRAHGHLSTCILLVYLTDSTNTITTRLCLSFISLAAVSFLASF